MEVAEYFYKKPGNYYRIMAVQDPWTLLRPKPELPYFTFPRTIWYLHAKEFWLQRNLANLVAKKLHLDRLEAIHSANYEMRTVSFIEDGEKIWRANLREILTQGSQLKERLKGGERLTVWILDEDGKERADLPHGFSARITGLWHRFSPTIDIPLLIMAKEIDKLSLSSPRNTEEPPAPTGGLQIGPLSTKASAASRDKVVHEGEPDHVFENVEDLAALQYFLEKGPFSRVRIDVLQDEKAERRVRRSMHMLNPVDMGGDDPNKEVANRWNALHLGHDIQTRNKHFDHFDGALDVKEELSGAKLVDLEERIGTALGIKNFNFTSEQINNFSVLNSCPCLMII